MIRGKKAVLKFSFIILSLFAVVFLVIYASGVFAETHTSSAVIDPGWVSCNAGEIEFTVTITNTGNPGDDPIYNVKIYNDTNTAHEDFKCGPAPSGWFFKCYNSINQYCEYETSKSLSNDDLIASGESLNFSFNATMIEECEHEWKTATTDIKEPIGDVYYTSPTITADCTAPETKKYFLGPKKEEGGVEWIDGVTYIKLISDDSVGPHDSGIDKIWYGNYLAESEAWCRYPDKYCYVPSYVENCIEDKSECIFEAQDYCIEEEGYAKYSEDWYDCVEEEAHDECDVEEEWHIYTGTFQKEEESCHILYYLGIDNMGNIEDVQINCFFVDKTPPISSKEIGEPNYGGCPSGTEPSICEGWTDCGIIEEKKDFMVTGRYGDNDPTAGAWELAIGVPDTSTEEKTKDQENFDWDSGVAEDFSLSYDPSDGSIVYTVGGTTLTWTYDTGKAFGYIVPLVKGKSGGNYAELTDMVLNGKALPDINSGSGLVGVKVLLADSEQVNGFTITGKAKLVWGEGPSNERPGFHVFAMNTHNLDPEDCWVRDHVTPITLDCQDQEPHPSGDEEVCYKVSFDGDPADLTDDYCDEFGGEMKEITQEGHEGTWCCADVSDGNPTENKYTLYFMEDSLHDLEYFCKDAVDKKSEVDIEWFRVDSQPPIINKTMFGSYLGDCPEGTDLEHGDCYVADNNESGVNITVEDDDTYDCAVGGINCTYVIKLDGEPIDRGVFSESTSIKFTQDSNHTLIVNCTDALGNSVEDIEEFLVDSKPPETNKTYEGPYKADPACEVSCKGVEECIHETCTQWITSSTSVTLTATDEKVGVDKIYWANNIVPDQACWEPLQYCSPVETNYIMVEGNTTTFYKQNESCHLIQYYSVDKLGNEEEVQAQCVFVDNTTPETNKTVDEPKIEGYDKWDWYVTNQTPIILDCADTGEHPVEQEILYWRFSTYAYEGEEPTYSEWEPVSYTEFPVVVKFEDDCWHNLEYYCVDHLGNAEAPHVQYYIVDSQAPVINKTIVGPQSGDCPPEAQGDVCYLDGETEIHVNPYDPEPHPVDNVSCEWRYSVDGGDPTDWSDVFPIQFPEESEHELYIKCKDALGNEVEDVEMFLVDQTPPITTKRYGEPYVENGDAEWITSDTEIYLAANDEDGEHISGVKATYYRTRLLQNPNNWHYCYDGCEDWDGIPDHLEPYNPSPWMEYEELPFTINEESCHVIEYYSVDNVNKTEDVKRQCVFVDNTPPTPVKEVGEPKSKWDGEGAYFYDIDDLCWNGQQDEIECWKVTMNTPIILNCTDPEPHPVDNEYVCFKVEVDGDDWTEEYCENDLKEGWCCLESTTDEFVFEEETEHNLEYYCVDELENKGPVDEEKFKVEGVRFDIPLYKKWNLISVPFVLLNDNPAEVFKDTNNVTSVWTYNGSDWKVFYPDKPDLSDLEHIRPGDGYWVLVDCMIGEECEIDRLVLGGALMQPAILPPSKPLVKGWNLIGYYGTSWELYKDMDDKDFVCGEAFNFPDRYIYGDKVYCSLNSLIDTQEGFPRWSSLWSYLNCGCYKAFWIGLNTCPSGIQGQFDRMYAGRGYWIEMDVEDTYSPATTCIWNDDNICLP